MNLSRYDEGSEGGPVVTFGFPSFNGEPNRQLEMAQAIILRDPDEKSVLFSRPWGHTAATEDHRLIFLGPTGSSTGRKLGCVALPCPQSLGSADFLWRSFTLAVTTVRSVCHK